MYLNRRALLGLALGSSVAGGIRAERPAPDSDVPQAHWAYDEVNWFMEQGIDVYAPERYGVKPAFTRRQFAGFTATIAAGTDWLAQCGWPRRPRRVLNWQGPDVLARLADEFEPELRLTGGWTAEFQKSCGRLAQLWLDGRPQGVRVPLIHPNRPYDKRARDSGRRQAQEAWSGGRPYLLLDRRLPDDTPEFSGAIPIRYKQVPDESYSGVQELAGHNEEMWRLFRERGVSREYPLSWVGDLFDLPRVFVKKGATALLDERHPGVRVPGSNQYIVWGARSWDHKEDWNQLESQPDGRLRWKRPRHFVRLALAFGGRDGETQLAEVPEDRVAGGGVELRWGPEGSGIVYVRVRVDDTEKPQRIYAVDLRMGHLLGAAAAG